MGFLEEFQRHNRDARDAYADEAVEDAKYKFAIAVARVLKTEKINDDKAKRIISEGFDIKPSQASEIWGEVQ